MMNEGATRPRPVFNRPEFAVVLAVFALVAPAAGNAHGIAGDRVFPATLVTDDPAAASEISLPTVDWFKQTRDENGNVPKETDVGAELDLLVAPHFALGISDGWSSIATKHESIVQGTNNIELLAKYQFYENDEHEVLLSAGLVTDLGGTGAARIAESTSTFTPTFYFGKGMGDLPAEAALLRPLAFTGTFGSPSRRRRVVRTSFGQASLSNTACRTSNPP